MRTRTKVAVPILAVAVLVAGYAFRPERLVVNRRVDEAMPNAPGALAAQPLESGRLYSILHPTEGVDFVLKPRINRASGKSGQSVTVLLEQNGLTKTVEGSHVLVATGRTPNTQGIGLESAGVELSHSGYIKVNENLQTTAPGVWAIGEGSGQPAVYARKC